MMHMTGILRLVETIPLPTEGYMDHCSYDLKNQHLFISGEHNKEIVVVDMKAGKVIHETKVAGNPRKPFFDSATNELWVDLGRDQNLLQGAPFYNAFLGVGQQNLAIPAQFALLTSSLRIRQDKRKMRTSKGSKPEILDNAPALCGVRKGNPDKVQVKRRYL